MRKLKSVFFSAAVAILLMMGESCVSHDFPSYTCVDPDVSYSADVDTIIKTKCTLPTCHNGDNGSDKNWTNFALFQSKSGEVKRRVTHRIMPPSNTPGEFLTQDEINTIACWVDQGANAN